MCSGCCRSRMISGGAHHVNEWRACNLSGLPAARSRMAQGDLLLGFRRRRQRARFCARRGGHGLVKLDKDSNILWSYAAGVHHDVDVAADGTIYAIQQETVHSMPDGLGFIPTPCLVDSLILLTPDGKLKGKPIPLLEAFRDSPYAALLQSLEPSKKEDE